MCSMRNHSIRQRLDPPNINNYLWILLLIVCLTLVNGRQLTSRAFKGGKDIDDEQLFICRSYKYGQIIPGKYSTTLGKCSVTHNRMETQFVRYEILVESNHTRYEWIQLKKPVTKLPDNVLFGGNRYPGQIKVQQQPIIPNLADDNGQLNSHSLDLILSNDRLWGTRRRRVRRSISSPNDEDWSPNWRGQPSNGVEMMQSFNSRMLNERIGNVNQTESKPICVPGQIMVDQAKCRHDPQKNNYYIGRCTLRTGDKLSEQIGKIWWMDSIQEWIASIPFAGHEDSITNKQQQIGS